MKNKRKPNIFTRFKLWKVEMNTYKSWLLGLMTFEQVSPSRWSDGWGLERKNGAEVVHACVLVPEGISATFDEDSVLSYINRKIIECELTLESIVPNVHLYLHKNIFKINITNEKIRHNIPWCVSWTFVPVYCPQWLFDWYVKWVNKKYENYTVNDESEDE